MTVAACTRSNRRSGSKKESIPVHCIVGLARNWGASGLCHCMAGAPTRVVTLYAQSAIRAFSFAFPPKAENCDIESDDGEERELKNKGSTSSQEPKKKRLAR